MPNNRPHSKPTILGFQTDHTNRLFLSAIPSILIGIDPSGKVTLWNAASEAAFDLTPEMIVGRDLKDCEILWAWDIIEKGIRTSQETGRLAQIEDSRFTRPDGTEGFLGITITPIHEEGASCAGYLLLAKDITERKSLQSQIAFAQKMESIGQLAAGVAHEINTPIQYVGDNIRFLSEAFKDIQRLREEFRRLLLSLPDETVVQYDIREHLERLESEADLDYLLGEIPRAFEQSLDGTERIAKIVQAMKEFSHPGGHQKVATDINRALENTIAVTRSEWKYCAEVVSDFDHEIPLIPCLPGDLNQVFLNVLINAAHAVADKGGSFETDRITVSTRLEEGWVVVRIRDTGTGIPESARNRVFDPFFTTKEVGRGTGQGLAISHSIVVDKHGGRIWFESETGVGTVFIISLPISAEMILPAAA